MNFKDHNMIIVHSMKSIRQPNEYTFTLSWKLPNAWASSTIFTK